MKSIGLTREEGIQEGRKAGQQELLDQVRTDFQGVFNRGFRDRWKSALKKAKVSRTSKWFVREKTPLPYPDAGLRASNAEQEDDEDDEDEEADEAEAEEIGGELDQHIAPLIPPASNPPAINLPAPSDPAPLEPAPPTDP